MAEYTVHRADFVNPVTAATAYPVHAGAGIFVSGATGGIGRAIVQLLAEQGARIAAADIDTDRLRHLVTGLGGEAAGIYPVRLDLLDTDSISTAVTEATEALGAIDKLVNVAGVERMGSALELTKEVWDWHFGINVFGPFELSRQFARHLISRGAGGAIVNVASDAGKKGHQDMAAYNASKAAVISLTRTLAEEWAPYGINVNAVTPGGVDTPMLHNVAHELSAMTGEPWEKILAATAAPQLGRHVATVEVARMVSFLLTNQVQATRGVSINIDGGELPY